MKKSLLLFFTTAVLFCSAVTAFGQIPTTTLIQIVKAEDERRWDTTLEKLLDHPNAEIRKRAALAAGRIGAEASIPLLIEHLRDAPDVRAMIVFALGETESAAASQAILDILKSSGQSNEVRARALEAAGKIAAAKPKDAKFAELGKTIVDVLNDEAIKPNPDKLSVLLGITAVLRARPEGGEAVSTKFLNSSDARVRADALNTLARLRSKTVNEKSRELLKNDPDAVVRANAARMLGVGEDKTAIDLLVNAATKDTDSRVRVSAIRSLGGLKDVSVADKLIPPISTLPATVFATGKLNKSEMLEIAITLSRLLPNTNNQKAVDFLNKLNQLDQHQSPEINIALAKIAPKAFVTSVLNSPDNFFSDNWRTASATYQGLAEIANLESNKENDDLKASVRVLLVRRLAAWADLPGKVKVADDGAFAIPDLLSAFAAFKSENTSNILRPLITLEPDVQVRATIAGILAQQPASKENVEALKKAFDAALLNDKHENDAQLALLDALFKLDKKEAVGTLLVASSAPDYLVRKKAFELLKTEGLEKDFPGLPTSLATFTAKKKHQILPYAPAFGTKLGQILNTQADYLRAVSRKNGTVKALFITSRGAFTIEFFPENAPLTVDNFIKLAKSNYFNGVSVHRVVANFVMQDGDPRGDGNGSPGWEIRCELNMLPYERGSVGMALSGKDTGGSQWFVTHSPQPHLDGGYTVFGKVNETGMKVVDSIVRGDKIVSVKIGEEASRPGRGKGAKTTGNK